jgi:hypothetical protein
METALSVPTHPVSSNFLNSLIFLSYIRQHPEPLPEFGKDDAGQKAARAQWNTRMANYDLIVHAYVARLANAIAQKQAAAAAISIQTLLSYQQNDQSKDSTSSRQELAASLAKVFLDLPVESERNLLENNWQQIADPSMLPVLRQLYAHPPDLHEIPAPFPGVALQRIYELSPVEGRQLILDEIKRPVPRVNIQVLGSLPDKELPELEDAIIQHLIDFKGEYRSEETAAALIARYVSPASLPRVREAFEDKIGTFGCTVQSSLIEYFLHSDQEFGLQMIRKELAVRKGTRCYATALGNAAVSDEQLTPPAESLVLEYLNDSDPDTVLSAVALLAAHGSSDSRSKIKAAITQLLERLRTQKRDPESDMSSEDPIQVGYFAESLLRNYIHGLRWLVDDDELTELANLCLGEECRRQTKSWSPMHRTEITLYRPSGLKLDTRFSVGIFERLTWKDLKMKLIQFPKGTQFTWQLYGREDDEDRKFFDELEGYLKDHGMEIARPPEMND